MKARYLGKFQDTGHKQISFLCGSKLYALNHDTWDKDRDCSRFKTSFGNRKFCLTCQPYQAGPSEMCNAFSLDLHKLGSSC